MVKGALQVLIHKTSSYKFALLEMVQDLIHCHSDLRPFYYTLPVHQVYFDVLLSLVQEKLARSLFIVGSGPMMPVKVPSGLVI